MRLKPSMEEALWILLFLAEKQAKGPVKSETISRQLNVSDSYLKKIMRKLVLAGIVTSNAHKGGGFQLAKKLDKIFLLDVYYAIEGKKSLAQIRSMKEPLFISPEEATKVMDHLSDVFAESEQLFLQKLGKYPLSNLIE